MKKSILAIACLLTLGSAQAGQPYIGAQYANITYDESGFPGYDLGSLVARGGYSFTDHLAVEGRIAFGLSDESHNISGTAVSVELDQLYGVYAVGTIPAGDTLDLYALAGYTDAEVTASSATASASASDSGISLGVGGRLHLGNDTAITAEYTQYLDESAYTLSGISIGFVTNF